MYILLLIRATSVLRTQTMEWNSRCAAPYPLTTDPPTYDSAAIYTMSPRSLWNAITSHPMWGTPEAQASWASIVAAVTQNDLGEESPAGPTPDEQRLPPWTGYVDRTGCAGNNRPHTRSTWTRGVVRSTWTPPGSPVQINHTAGWVAQSTAMKDWFSEWFGTLSPDLKLHWHRHMRSTGKRYVFNPYDVPPIKFVC